MNLKRKDILVLFILFIIAIILLYFYPAKRQTFFTTTREFFLELILILPPVVLLMGMFAVFVPREMVSKFLGKSAGIKSIFIGILLGTLPTGPLYLAFPIGALLLKKGVRVSSVIAFLSSWACIKIPQELVEIQFLGIKFTLLRLFITIVFVFFMSISIEKIVEFLK